MDIIALSLAFIIGFITMFIGAISGGVGLVLRPALLFLGFSVTTIIGTVRIAAIPGELPSLILLYKHKRVNWKITLFLIIPMILSSAIAAIAVVSVFKGWLNLLFGILLLIAGLILLLNRKIGMEEREIPSSILRHTIAFTGTFVISFFSTIVGGLGPLYTSLYMAVYGKSYTSASALWRFAGYIGNLAAAVVFVVSGIIDWSLAIFLGFGCMLGSYFGTKHGLKKGESWVRTVVLIVVFASVIKLLFF